MKSIQRILYIDYLKAFAILVVVMGHLIDVGMTSINVVRDYWIMPYHMPLFAILSGLFFSVKPDAVSFVKKKFIQIALPLLVWCFISNVLIVAIHDIQKLVSEGQPIHIIGLCKWWLWNYYEQLTNWSLWFLRALFLAFLYAYFAIRVCKRNVLMGVCLSVFLLYALSLTGIIPNMWMRYSTFLYPFFCIGILLKEFKDYVLQYDKGITALSLFVFIICFCFWDGFDDTFYRMNTSVFEKEGNAGITGMMVLTKTLNRFALGTSASIALILLGRKFATISPSSTFVSHIGRNTLGIYCLQGFMLSIFTPPSYLLDNKVLTFLTCVTLSVVIVVVSSVIVDLTSKNRILRLFLWGKTA